MEARTSPAAQALRFLALRVSRQGIEEWQDERRMAFLPAEQVLGLSVARGFTADRPVLQALVGAAFLFAGLLYLGMAPPIVSQLLEAPSMEPMESRGLRPFVLVLPFLIGVGGWGLITALRRGTYVLAATSRGPRKLQLHGPFEEAVLSAFLVDAMRVLRGEGPAGEQGAPQG